MTITIKRNVDFGPITAQCMKGGQPSDLTGWTAKAEARKYPGPDYPLVASITCEITDPAQGFVTVTIPTDAPAGRYGFDVILTGPSGERVLLFGRTLIYTETYTQP